MIPSYLKVMDRPWGKWNGAKGDPADHLIKIDEKRPDGLFGPDGRGPVEVDVRFRAVQDMDLDEFFRGKECTAFWLPEFDTHASSAILSYCTNRVGRFPEPEDRPETAPTIAYAGVWGDANTPTIGSWFEKEFYGQARPGITVHKQPPGYDPDEPDGFHVLAENKANLKKIRPDYYRNMASTMEEADVRRLLQCKLTYGRLGVPVHPAFDETKHVGPSDMEPDPELPVLIGVDVDFKGAATFGQRSLFGQWSVYAEVVAEDAPDGEMDVIEFADAIVNTMKTVFPRCKKALLIVDPAAKARSTLNRQLSWAQELSVRTKIAVVPAPTNDPLIRRTALARPLKRHGGWNAHPRCTWLINALNGGFHYPKKGNGSSQSAKKNEFSSVGESAEYMAMGGEGLEDRAGLLPSMSLHGAGASNVVEVVFD
ncbi:hypothetical protein [Brevundimonas sp.]|uniref:hypothetical protein n=1 Tax=Brevundimonas sp. TaxID=1871086 RepID=UPI0028982B1B|nr:hypothetical protein [Brevundimonas sp.]